MNLAKVWNDNDHPFKQDHKGTPINIPAHAFIEMEYSEAISFKSSASPMEFDGMGQPKPTCFKRIRVEGEPDSSQTVVAYRCHMDNTLHHSKEALDAYSQQFVNQKVSAPEEKRGPGRPRRLEE